MPIVNRHIRLDSKTDEQIQAIAKKNGDSMNETIRKLINKGLAVEWNEENLNEIAKIVREQLSVILKPHIERLAALNSKTLHMAATSTYLNVQALQDLVPLERKKDVVPMYEKARKMAVAYARGETISVNENSITIDTENNNE